MRRCACFAMARCLAPLCVAAGPTAAQKNAPPAVTAHDILAAVSDRLSALPRRASRAEALLRAQPDSPDNIGLARTRAARAIRLAAKETRDAYRDIRDLLDRKYPEHEIPTARNEWDALARQGEAARETGDFDAALEAYAQALEKVLTFFRQRQTERSLVKTAPAEQTNDPAPTADPAPPPSPSTDGCPASVVQAMERARTALQSDAQSPQSRSAVAAACRIMLETLPRLSSASARECLERAAQLAPAMSPTHARHLLVAAVENGRNLDTPVGAETQSAWTALRQRSIPAFFEIVSDPHPPLPLKTADAEYGLVLDDSPARLLFEALPRKVRTVRPFFPQPGAPAMTFLLVPPGQLSFPDDEGRIRRLVNPAPFYMAAAESRWSELAALYESLGAKQRTELQWNAAARRVLAGAYAGVLSSPVRYADRNMIDDLCRWLNERLAAESAKADQASGPDDLFVATDVERWRFAACLDLLAHAAQEGKRPSYRWWRQRRSRFGWNAAAVNEAPARDPGGWGFHHLCGNVAEWAVTGARAAAPRRCGGSYRDTAAPILSYPLYDHEAREGADDLGFRLIFAPAPLPAFVPDKEKPQP
jgi:tetratricopeptide (TPR) repeat protein